MMKKLVLFFLILQGLFEVQTAWAQYSISGILDVTGKNKKVYLSLLAYNEQMAIADHQIITYTQTDSLGFFSFEGKLLSNKHALYRIHSKFDENIGPNQLMNSEELKSFQNFVFSNNDTIVFQANKKHWFSSYNNTNPIDEQWQTFNEYAKQLYNEFLSITDTQLQKQSSIHYLNELKSYAIERKTHPLTTLVLIASASEDVLKRNITDNPDFYRELQDDLIAYYGDNSYAEQFETLLSDLSKDEIQIKLRNAQTTNYILGFLCVLCLITIIFLNYRLKQAKAVRHPNFNLNLTNQEERVAELIFQGKGNKEIATALFVSLSTVKTHIRNIYAKMEVSNREEFQTRYKNHTRD